MNWIGMAQDRDRRRDFVISVMKVQQNAGNISSGFITGGLSSCAHLHS
jgi:hypothetical protein